MVSENKPNIIGIDKTVKTMIIHRNGNYDDDAK